jgi:hypothetical protein
LFTTISDPGQQKGQTMTNGISLIHMLVDIVSHDYESIDMIEEEVAAWALEEGLSFSQPEIRDALASACKQGLVQPYRYSSTKGSFRSTQLTVGAYDALYFLATKKGKESLA